MIAKALRATGAALRRHLLLVIVIAVLVTGSGWAAGAYWQLQASRTAFAGGDYSSAAAHGERFLTLSPWERHKGHLAIGTARAGDGALAEAEESLLEALALTPPADECTVRINLALVQEAQAEEHREAEDVDAADERYDTALATLQEAPEECRPEDSQQDEEMSEQEDRVEAAQEEMHSPPESGGDDTGGDDTGGGSTDGGDEGSDGGDEGSDGGDGGGEGGGEPPQGPEGGEDERLDELRERQRESEERYSESNSGEGDGVRTPGSKPW